MTKLRPPAPKTTKLAGPPSRPLLRKASASAIHPDRNPATGSPEFQIGKKSAWGSPVVSEPDEEVAAPLTQQEVEAAGHSKTITAQIAGARILQIDSVFRVDSMHI